MTIYGSFATGKSTFIFEHRFEIENNTLDIDVLLDNNCSKLKLTLNESYRNRIYDMLQYFIQSEYNIFSCMWFEQQRVEVGQWKFDIAFVRSLLDAELLATKAFKQIPEDLLTYLRNESLYISEFADTVITLKQGQFINDYLTTQDGVIKFGKSEEV